MSDKQDSPLKRISQLYIEHENGQPPEVVEIVLPVEQILVAKDSDKEESLLSAISWGKF